MLWTRLVKTKFLNILSFIIENKCVTAVDEIKKIYFYLNRADRWFKRF